MDRDDPKVADVLDKLAEAVRGYDAESRKIAAILSRLAEAVGKIQFEAGLAERLALQVVRERLLQISVTATRACLRDPDDKVMAEIAREAGLALDAIGMLTR